MQARCGRTAKLSEPVAHEIRSARQLRQAELGNLRAHDLDLGVGCVENGESLIARDCREHDEVAQPLQEIRSEAARILPGVDDPVDDREESCSLAGRDGVDGVVE